ncbi:two-component system, NarL family, sensor histidine kinase EvgS [Gammaproteobacteria bacterium]
MAETSARSKFPRISTIRFLRVILGFKPDCRLLSPLILLCFYMTVWANPAWSAAAKDFKYPISEVPQPTPQIQLSPEERAWIAAHPVIRLGTDRSFAPYVKPQASGKITGIEPDILARINALTGANIQLVLGDWPDIVARAERGELDGLAVSSPHPERKAHFLFSDSPYSIFRYIYTRKAAPARSMADLAGKKVGVRRASLVEQKLLARWPQIIPVDKASSQELTVALLKGEVDAALSGPSFLQAIHENLFSGLDLAFVVPDSEAQILYSVRKENPELQSILNKALATIGQGEIHAIMEKWGGIYPKSSADELALSEEDRAWVREHPVVHVRIGDFPPYHFWDNGPQGISVELLDTIAKKTGLRFEYLYGSSWSEAMEGFQKHTGIIDMVPTAKRTTEREEFMAFSQDYLHLPWMIFTRNDDNRIFSLEDLFGKTIAVENAYILQEQLAKQYPQIQQLKVKEAAEALLALSAGKVDAYIGNLPVAQYYIARRGLSNIKVSAGTTLGVHTQAFAVRKDWAQLAAILDKGLADIPQTERSKIERKYFSVAVTEQLDYSRVLQVAGVALVIIGIFLYSNRIMAREISQRKALNVSLRESESRYRRITETVPAMLYDYVLHPDGSSQFLYVGPRCRDLLELTENDLLNDAGLFWKMVYEEDLQRLKQEDRSANREEKVFSSDVRITTSSGHLKWIQLSSQPNPAPPGELTVWSGFMLDITGRKLAEQKLSDAVVAAKAANVAKSRFLATMSHEIRTPMNGILGMAQMLLMPDLKDYERHDYARTILNSGRMLLTLLNDILDLSKVEAGKVMLESTALNPQQILSEITALFTEIARSKSLALDSVWTGPADQRYLGDSNRLRQMLSNLVGNAIKFTPQGQIRIEVREVKREGEYATLEFAVSDTGIGIPKEAQTRLFEPFSQADSLTTRKYGGTGLGLSIVRGLAQLMDGEGGCESEPGQGSRFWFRIRVRLVAAGTNSRQANRLNAEDDPAVLPTRFSGRVFVVEDNAINRKVIEAMLKQFGVMVELTSDGQQALDAIRGGDPADLILMDVHMPVMDGYAATQQIRQWETETGKPRRPIIALTADAFEEDRQRCLASGMDDFLSKPILFDPLKRMLNRWLGSQHAANASAIESLPEARPVDVPKAMAFVRKLIPLLAENSFDAFDCFNDLRETLAETDAAGEVAEMGRLLEEFRFSLALERLRQILTARGWEDKTP